MTGTDSILAGWLIDGSGAQAQEHVLIHLENGRILSIERLSREIWKGLQNALNDGKGRTCPDTNVRKEPAVVKNRSGNRNPGATQKKMCPRITMDLSHCTIVPGWVDSHVHMFMSGSRDPEVRSKQLRSPFLKARKVIARHLAQHLSHGVLAVRDGGDAFAHSLRYKRDPLSVNRGILMKSPGRAWHAQGRYGKLIGRPPARGKTLAQSIAISMEEPERLFPTEKTGDPAFPFPGSVDHVKIVNSGLNSLVCFGKETYAQFSAEDLLDAVQAARCFGCRIMVHANGKTPVRAALEAGCDSVEHGFFMGRENLERMAEKQVTWVPTACTMKAYAEELAQDSHRSAVAERILEDQLIQLDLARRLGVPVSTGTDSGSLGVHHGSSLREEVRLLMRAGFSLETALRCATANGARLLGIEKELGLLVPGLPATFLAFAAGPGKLPDVLGLPQAIFIRGKTVFFRPKEGQE